VDPDHRPSFAGIVAACISGFKGTAPGGGGSGDGGGIEGTHFDRSAAGNPSPGRQVTARVRCAFSDRLKHSRMAFPLLVPGREASIRVMKPAYV
jgi:hypothetical protein